MALSFSRLARLSSSAVALSASLALAQTPVPAPGTPAQSPQVQAMNAAGRITDAAQRLAAYEKIRVDFPTYTPVDQPLMTTLVNYFPERVDAVTEVFDRLMGRIVPTAAAETRVGLIAGPCGVLAGKKLLLDRCDRLMTDVVAGLDFEKYAQSRRDLASRSNQPEPPLATMQTAFNGAFKQRGVETLARIKLAKGDTAAAVAGLTESSGLLPGFTPAHTTLVEIHTARKDWSSAEQLLLTVIDNALKPPSPPPSATVAQAGAAAAAAASPSSSTISPDSSAKLALIAANGRAAGARLALANLYSKKGDDAKGEALLNTILAGAPTHRGATIAIAKIEAKRGQDAKALDHFMVASLAGPLAKEDDATMRQLYRKSHRNSEANFDNDLDKMYEDRFPNPVKPEPWKPSDKRTDRVVLLEMFTGSGCPPCVSADLALEAAMHRYPGEAIIAVNYHANIPAPDPMVSSGSDGRREYYRVSGVPTLMIDGAMGRLGGGARDATQRTYNAYIPRIDQALESPSGAEIRVSATGNGDKIDVSAQVGKIPAGATDLRLHILVVEEMLKFSGENGIRFHPAVVRAAAGTRGAGIPITGDGTTSYSFSLSEMKADVAKTLTTELEKRNATAVPGAPPRVYAAEGHAFTAIDTSRLTIVAFVQSGAYTEPPPNPIQLAAAGVETAATTTTATTGAEPPATAAAPPASGATPPTAGTASAAPKTNVLQATRAPVVYKKK